MSALHAERHGFESHMCPLKYYGLVVQFGRTSDLQSEGHGVLKFGPLIQLVECFPGRENVMGSNPICVH